jgi:hypothetical protein
MARGIRHLPPVLALGILGVAIWFAPKRTAIGAQM